MAKIEVNAMSRTLQGTGASRRLRGTGKVPGIIYGGEQAGAERSSSITTRFSTNSSRKPSTPRF